MGNLVDQDRQQPRPAIPGDADPVTGEQAARGIVIFGRSMQLRWANQCARDFVARGGRGTDIGSLNDHLPLEIIDLASRIHDELEAKSVSDEWSHIEHEAQVRTRWGLFCLHGYGFPGVGGHDHLHIVIVVTEGAPDSPALTSPGSLSLKSAAT